MSLVEHLAQRIRMRADRARARRHIRFMGYDRPLAERAAEAHRLAGQPDS